MKEKVNQRNAIYGGILDAEQLNPNTSHAKVLSRIKPGSVVMDVGCANGRLSSILKNNGCYVVGAEIDPELAEEAKSICDEVFIGDFIDIASKNSLQQRFDVVLMADVLEHMYDPWSALKVAHSLLKKNGIVVISLPNATNWKVRFSIAGGQFNYNPKGGLLDWGHIRFFSLKSAKALINDAGFVIEDFDTVASFPLTEQIQKIPLIRRLNRYIPNFAAKRCPNLFGYQFIFTVRPIEILK